jgi:hypothetical protein
MVSVTLNPAPRDPRPVPPVRPHSDECCHSGCEPCIFELYQDALERYQSELLAWEQRQSRKK